MPKNKSISARSKPMTSANRNSVENGHQPSTSVENTDSSAPDKNSGKKRRRRLLRIAIPLLLLVSLIFGFPYYLHSITHESTDDAFIDGHIIVISPRVGGHVAKVYVTENQWVNAGDRLIELDPALFQARLDAADAILAAARANRHSGSVEVDLTSLTASSNLDGAKANLSAAKAAVEAALAQEETAIGQDEQAKAQIAVSSAALGQAEAEAASFAAKHQRDAADLKRYREMNLSRTISEQDFDHVVATERVSAAELAAAEKKIETYRSMLHQAQAARKTAQSNLSRQKAEVAAARARLAQAEAQLAAAQSAPKRVEQSLSRAEAARANVDKANAEAAQARLNLSYTRINAPASGFVTQKSVEPGTLVEVGQALMAIVPATVWVTANFKETQLTRMRPGQPVKIKVDAYPDLTFQGHVESIQHGTGARFSLLPPQNATGNYVKVVQRVPVKINFDKIPEPDTILLSPGMSVVPEVDVAAEGIDSKKKKAAVAAP
jgi:membrane fusion protein (multidrug efflux system)